MVAAIACPTATDRQENARDRALHTEHSDPVYLGPHEESLLASSTQNQERGRTLLYSTNNDLMREL